MKNNIIKIFLVVVIIISVYVNICLIAEYRANGPAQNANTGVVTTTQTNGDITYTNAQYGFTLTLPKSWQGYDATSGPITTGAGAGTGFFVTLRNPTWTAQNPTMDIPIQIFTLAQWTEWEANHFDTYPTAAPIGPTERGRNARYVFATAPRYNYSFLPGFEEVENIIKTLKGF